MSFATATDIAARLGRPLADDEVAPVELLLDLATGAIAQAADKSDEWAAALTPVPTVIRGLCIELVARALANPQGITSLQDTLGVHSSTVRFRTYEGSGLILTAVEQLLVRRTIHGATSGSARTESIIHHCEEDPCEGS